MTQIRDGRTIPCEAVRRCMADLEGIPVCLVLVGWLLLATTTGTSESQIHLPDNQRKNNFVTLELSKKTDRKLRMLQVPQYGPHCSFPGAGAVVGEVQESVETPFMYVYSAIPFPSRSVVIVSEPFLKDFQSNFQHLFCV